MAILENPAEFGVRELRFLMSQAFAQARQANNGDGGGELALVVLDICHNVPRVLMQYAAGEDLRLPSDRRFGSIDEFWRLDLRPALDARPDTRDWAQRRFPEHYGVLTAVS
jgi:hypothetical protein